MIGYMIGLIGMWLFSDAIFSYTLYINAPSYEGSPKQSWKRDHWIRAIRAGLSIVLMVFGFWLV